MTDGSCLGAAVLLERRASGLGEADRLVLERHLETCERCANEARWLDAVVGALSSVPTAALRSSARERILAGALGGAARPDAAEPPQRVDRRWRAIGALAAAAALVIGGGSLWRSGAPVDAPADVPVAERSAAEAQATDAGRLLEGDAEVGGVALAPGGTWSAGSELVVTGRARVAVAQATVDLVAGSRASWHAGAATLRLEAGAAHVEVDPAAGKPFIVETPRLVVEVMGTGFDVDLDRVRVTHGRVRVRDAGSGKLLGELGTGEEMRADRVSEGPIPAASASVTAPPSGSHGAEREPGAPLLARGRAMLAQGQADEAERLVRSALQRRLSPSDKAEASSLLAECARARGDEAEAARRYAEVADQHRGRPAGETALFAAARAEERAGRREAAIALLRQYLATYPTGRFRREAEARLAAITPRSAP